jgi:hypothetical protein
MRTVNLVAILVIMNSVAVGLGASGVVDDWGIQPQVISNDEKLEEAESVGEDNATFSNPGTTLFGLINTAINALKTIIGVATAAPRLIALAPIPGWMVAMFFGPLYIYVAADLISAALRYSVS